MGCQTSRVASTANGRRTTGRRRHRSQQDEEALERQNAEIEEGLANTRRAEKAVKILLLGSGESGKSTVLKQMRVIHGLDFSQFERSQYTKVIWCDAVQSMRILLQQAQEMDIPLTSSNAEAGALSDARELLLSTDPHQSYEDDEEAGFLDEYVVEYGDSRRRRPAEETDLLLTASERPSRAQVAEAIDILWRLDEGIQACMQRSNEFQLEVNAKYYFENIFTYAQKDYLATDRDILVGRIKTTGITETVFNVRGMDFHMFDVGGQRSERRKWIHCFDNVTTILYVIAASEYDQVLFEDHTVNRMAEAFTLFESICNSRWFFTTPMILFLNKIDILAQKLATSSFKKYYPDFQGDETNADHVLAYLQQRLTALNTNTNRQVYVHQTCATDTESMKFVMQAVTDMVLQKNMTSSGII